jgi:N-acetyl sugar amidotransferase
MSNQYRECRRCVMDARTEDIVFDAHGYCNYCNALMARLADYQPAGAQVLAERLERFVAQVRRAGAGKRYDCIVGVSGGADSAYALWLAKRHGLRPLAVHMDNGWNSELAVNNIENLVRKLDVDLTTHVIEWQEYRALQQAFMEADVIDIELLYDNAMAAVNHRLASRYGIRYILAGSNTSTEGMRMPPSWAWYKFDRKNILALARRGGVRVRSMPTIGVAGFVWHRILRGVQWVPFLDYIDYNKQACIDELVRAIGYRPYPYKHYESVFTRFYQGYLLPQKFGVDKRHLHFSSLICSGQMTREEAVNLLAQSPYPNLHELETDVDYFLKKMGWTQDQLDAYLARPQRAHDSYPSEIGRHAVLRRLQDRLRALKSGILQAGVRPLPARSALPPRAKSAGSPPAAR